MARARLHLLAAAALAGLAAVAPHPWQPKAGYDFIPVSIIWDLGDVRSSRVRMCKLDMAAYHEIPSVYPMVEDMIQAFDCRSPKSDPDDPSQPSAEASSFDLTFGQLEADYVQRGCAEAVERGDLEPACAPSGIVFHESRCGSTVFSNMLAALPTSLMYSETGPPNAILRQSNLTMGERTHWLRVMWAAMGRPIALHGYQRRQRAAEGYTVPLPAAVAAGDGDGSAPAAASIDPELDGKGDWSPRYMFLKTQHTTSLYLDVYQAAFPRMPWVYLHREPVEVMMSLLRDNTNAPPPDAPATTHINDKILPYINNVPCMRTRTDKETPPYIIKVTGSANASQALTTVPAEDWCAADLSWVIASAVKAAVVARQEVLSRAVAIARANNYLAQAAGTATSGGGASAASFGRQQRPQQQLGGSDAGKAGRALAAGGAAAVDDDEAEGAGGADDAQFMIGGGAAGGASGGSGLIGEWELQSLARTDVTNGSEYSAALLRLAPGCVHVRDGMVLDASYEVGTVLGVGTPVFIDYTSLPHVVPLLLDSHLRPQAAYARNKAGAQDGCMQILWRAIDTAASAAGVNLAGAAVGGASGAVSGAVPGASGTGAAVLETETSTTRAPLRAANVAAPAQDAPARDTAGRRGNVRGSGRALSLDAPAPETRTVVELPEVLARVAESAPLFPSDPHLSAVASNMMSTVALLEAVDTSVTATAAGVPIWGDQKSVLAAVQHPNAPFTPSLKGSPFYLTLPRPATMLPASSASVGVTLASTALSTGAADAIAMLPDVAVAANAADAASGQDDAQAELRRVAEEIRTTLTTVGGSPYAASSPLSAYADQHEFSLSPRLLTAIMITSQLYSKARATPQELAKLANSPGGVRAFARTGSGRLRAARSWTSINTKGQYMNDVSAKQTMAWAALRHAAATYLLELRRTMERFNVPMDAVEGEEELAAAEKDAKEAEKQAADAKKKSDSGAKDEAAADEDEPVPDRLRLVLEPSPPLWHLLKQSMLPPPAAPSGASTASKWPYFSASALLPGRGYPQVYPLGDILTAWSADILTPPGTYGRFSSLRSVNFQTEFETAVSFRDARVPFVVRNVPALESTVLTLSSDKEVLNLLGGSRATYAASVVDEELHGTAVFPPVDPWAPPAAPAADGTPSRTTLATVAVSEWLRNAYALAEDMGGEERDQLPQWWGDVDDYSPADATGASLPSRVPGSVRFEDAGRRIDEAATADIAAAAARAARSAALAGAGNDADVVWSETAPLQVASTGVWRGAPRAAGLPGAVHDALATARLALARVRKQLPTGAAATLASLRSAARNRKPSSPAASPAAPAAASNGTGLAASGGRFVLPPKFTKAGVREDIAARPHGPPRPVSVRGSGAEGGGGAAAKPTAGAPAAAPSAPGGRNGAGTVKPRKLLQDGTDPQQSAESDGGRVLRDKTVAAKAPVNPYSTALVQALQKACDATWRQSHASPDYSLLCTSLTSTDGRFVYGATDGKGSGSAVYPPTLLYSYASGSGESKKKGGAAQQQRETFEAPATATHPLLLPYVRFHPAVEHAYGLPVRRPLLGPLPRAKRVRQLLHAVSVDLDDDGALPVDATPAAAGSKVKPPVTVKQRSWVDTHFSFLLQQQVDDAEADTMPRGDNASYALLFNVGDPATPRALCQLGQPGVVTARDVDMVNHRWISVARGYERHVLLPPDQSAAASKAPEEWISWSSVLGSPLRGAQALEVILQPGDVLFVPAGWTTMSVALTVNVHCERRVAAAANRVAANSRFPFLNTGALLEVDEQQASGAGDAATEDATRSPNPPAKRGGKGAGVGRGLAAIDPAAAAVAAFAAPRILPPLEFATFVPIVDDDAEGVAEAGEPAAADGERDIAAGEAKAAASVDLTTETFETLQREGETSESGAPLHVSTIVSRTVPSPSPSSAPRAFVAVPLEQLVPAGKRVTSSRMMQLLGLPLRSSGSDLAIVPPPPPLVPEFLYLPVGQDTPVASRPGGAAAGGFGARPSPLVAAHPPAGEPEPASEDDDTPQVQTPPAPAPSVAVAPAAPLVEPEAEEEDAAEDAAAPSPAAHEPTHGGFVGGLPDTSAGASDARRQREPAREPAAQHAAPVGNGALSYGDRDGTDEGASFKQRAAPPTEASRTQDTERPQATRPSAPPQPVHPSTQSSLTGGTSSMAAQTSYSSMSAALESVMDETTAQLLMAAGSVVLVAFLARCALDRCRCCGGSSRGDSSLSGSRTSAAGSAGSLASFFSSLSARPRSTSADSDHDALGSLSSGHASVAPVSGHVGSRAFGSAAADSGDSGSDFDKYEKRKPARIAAADLSPSGHLATSKKDDDDRRHLDSGVTIATPASSGTGFGGGGGMHLGSRRDHASPSTLAAPAATVAASATEPVFGVRTTVAASAGSPALVAAAAGGGGGSGWGDDEWAWDDDEESARSDAAADTSAARKRGTGF